MPQSGFATMSLVQSAPEIELYPESDGKPMAETDVHLDCMIHIRAVLKWRYRGERVYVGSNLLVYYAKAQGGKKGRAVAPDNFVVKDCDPGMRRVFKIWEEGRVPNTVFEVTSDSTRAEDEREKPEIYARMGVKEMFLFDPTCDYLDPPLQGYRFIRGEPRRIKPDETGALTSKELGIRLRLEDGRLVIYDVQTGERLLTEAEAERQAKEAERQAKEAERQAKEAERQAAAAERAAREAAEEEVRRLKAELARRPPAAG
jgi:Uma2 family endonuclease